VDRRGCSPLIVAATRGHEEVVETLLRLGAQIDRQDTMGNSALMMAATGGHLEVVKILLQAGASTMLQDRENLTAVGLAGLYGHIETTNVLIEAGEKQIHSHAQQHRHSIHQLAAAKASSAFADSGMDEGEMGFRIEEIEAMLSAAPDLNSKLKSRRSAVKIADSIFDRIDLNGDGVIDRGEFQAAFGGAPEAKSPEPDDIGADHKWLTQRVKDTAAKQHQQEMEEINASPSGRKISDFQKATDILGSAEPTEESDPVLARARRLAAEAAVNMAIMGMRD